MMPKDSQSGFWRPIRETKDACGPLWTMEREWRGADGGIPMSWQPVNIPAVPSS
jgi:hypothetical protein